MIRVSLPGSISTPASQAQGIALDSGVWFRFVTQSDDHVRPAHAALHGSVWRVSDPEAPVPPLDYGCRCGIEYIAEPGSPAAEVLEPAEVLPEPPAVVFASYLDKELPDWRKYAKAAEGKPRQDVAGILAVEIKNGEGWSLSRAQDFADIVARVILAGG
jgi:hypothetical protein